jgi:hypothetical protein
MHSRGMMQLFFFIVTIELSILQCTGNDETTILDTVLVPTF